MVPAPDSSEKRPTLLNFIRLLHHWVPILGTGRSGSPSIRETIHCWTSPAVRPFVRKALMARRKRMGLMIALLAVPLFGVGYDRVIMIRWVFRRYDAGGGARSIAAVVASGGGGRPGVVAVLSTSAAAV